MNRLPVLCTVLMLAFPASPKPRSDIVREMCGDIGKAEFCHLPFDLVHLHRKAFYGVNVQLEGILMVGKQEHTSDLRLLLFPSVGQAAACDLRRAVELTPISNQIADAIAERVPHADYWLVSVSGYFQRSPRGLPEPFSSGYWADITLLSEPVLIAEMDTGFRVNCIAPPPPVLPLPEAQEMTANAPQPPVIPKPVRVTPDCMPGRYESGFRWLILAFDPAHHMLRNMSGLEAKEPFVRRFHSGVECVEFAADTLCGPGNTDIIGTGFSMERVRMEVVTTGDGSRIKTTVWDVTRDGFVSRVFLTDSGDVIAWSSYLPGLGLQRFTACSVAGALRLHGWSE